MLSKLKTYFKSKTELNNKVGKLEHQIELMKEHIQTQNDEVAFRYYYAMKANNPYNYGMPRQIRLGVKLDF